MEQFQAAGRYAEKHPNAKEEDLLPATVPPLEKEISELKSLGAPEADGQKVNAIIDALEEAVEAAKRNPRAILASQGGAFEKPDELAKKYGFTVCANNP